ncbi:MAG TPA: UvrD-helicase domain-containing protein [Polyangiaceae bacterium]|nr:UvrD-helicase domain-containing protein [Polyangiaceae bacterium]
MDSSSEGSFGREVAEPMLNEPQTEAVLHAQGPLLVLAGAGSGKTRVITYRVANLLAEHGVPPYRLLAVTFTNKAAAEMRQRLDRLVGPEVVRDLWVGTFHATCARLLRRYHAAVGLSRDFVIYDDSDQKAVVTRILRASGIDEKQYPPKAFLHAIHQAKQDVLLPEDLPSRTPFEKLTRQVYEAFQEKLRAANAVDFDDLILHVMRIGESRTREEGEELRRKFRHVLVDEFQDVNAAQYRLVRALVEGHHNLCVVGDDDQSIYRWRGADVRIIRGFRKDFAEAQVVKLEENYRSTGNIVRSALGVIRRSGEREPKELFTQNPNGAPVLVVATRDERDEAACVVEQIREALRRGVEPKDIAVFYRIHAQSRVLEEAMRAEGLPYQIVGGTRFFDRAEVKDVLAYLRVLANPSSDVDLLRIINVPARGIGAATVDRIAEAASRAGISVHDAVLDRLDACGLAGAASKRVAGFAAMLRSLRAVQDAGPRELAERVLEATGYAKALKDENTAEADARLENVSELLSSLEDYEDEAVAAGGTPTLQDYLERVSLESDADKLGKEGARVPMMTVHAAKGLEFTLVLLTGLEEDLFPYRSPSRERDDLEEERRLAYVAVTRAREQLVITHASTRMIFGTTRYCQPSRFLGDMPEDAVEHAVSRTLSGSMEGRVRPAMFVRETTRQVARETTREAGERYVEMDPDETWLSAGRSVEHTRFGVGKVVRLESAATPPVVIVHFAGWGEKRIVASFLKPA